MDDFAPREEKKLKEKNLYILHLDTPRIIIISCVFFGIIVIAVLVGMNINKKSDRDIDIFANDNAVLDNLITENRENDPALNNNALESSLENSGVNIKNPDNSYSPADNSFNKSTAMSGDNFLASNHGAGSAAQPGQAAGNTSDILTHENIETIIPPANVLKKSEPKAVNKPKKIRKKTTQKKKSIVEVSSGEKVRKAPDKGKTYYSIQVASYDDKSKARSEIKRLEKNKYDAYVDSAYVSGKRYYRVRVGPVYSKKEACKLLDEITVNSRYEESYIIKN